MDEYGLFAILNETPFDFDFKLHKKRALFSDVQINQTYLLLTFNDFTYLWVSDVNNVTTNYFYLNIIHIKLKIHVLQQINFKNATKILCLWENISPKMIALYNYLFTK